MSGNRIPRSYFILPLIFFLYTISGGSLYPDHSKNQIKECIIHYNKGVAHLQANRTAEAEKELDKALRLMQSISQTNNPVAGRILLNLGYAYFAMGRIQRASKFFNQIILSMKILGKKPGALEGHAFNNTAVILMQQNKAGLAKKYFKKASLIYRRSRHREDARDASRRIKKIKFSKALSDTGLPREDSAGFFKNEILRLKSYLWNFKFKRHSQVIRARTYPGRQQDTLVLIRDLINLRTGERGSLRLLRKYWLGAKYSGKKPEQYLGRFKEGNNITFVDIGPAISNRWTPAVTALALCNEFRRMSVVGLDLPGEVEIFKKKLSIKTRRRVLAYDNFHILSGDGTKSIRTQFTEKKRWTLIDRPIPILHPGDPIIIRTANAIDVYFPWKVIQPVLVRMSLDFKDNPLIIIFNRSIIFKRRGSTHLQIIGALSRRGFWHNSLSFNRRGEPPYIIIDYFLK